jgi:mannose-6-phosphate isomerase
VSDAGGRPRGARLDRLDPTPVARPWGGDGIPSLALAPPSPDVRVGEYWLPADDFPLLVKILDARERLSIQVHPDDATARAMGLPSGKTEAWFVLATAPGAELWLGLREGVAGRDFFAAAARGENVSSLLVRHEPRAGDIYFVPAGTLHAIGAGLTILEVQQRADVTFRVHDWGRLPARELHLEAAQRSLREDARAGRFATGDTNRAAGGATRLACEHFTLERLTVASETELPAIRSPRLVFCAAGHGVAALSGLRAELAPGRFFLADPGECVGDRLSLRPARDGADLDVVVTAPFAESGEPPNPDCDRYVPPSPSPGP